MKNNLEEIANWKIDATHKLNEHYFYKHKIVDNVLSGDSSLIIGRKGTGKTALALHLVDKPQHDKFTAYIDFRDLRGAVIDLGATTELDGINQWITIWKAILGQQIVTLMGSNASLSAAANTDIQNFLSSSPLNRGAITELKPNKVSTNVKIPYFEITRTTESDGHIDGRLWAIIDRQCREIISNYVDKSKYLIVVDCVGDDVQTITKGYEQIVIGIIKAVIQMRTYFDDLDINIFPYVFLRDDIFRELIDPDASKWNDHAGYLSWGEHSLRDMLTHRIQRACNLYPKVGLNEFSKSLSCITDVKSIYDGKNNLDIFKWMWRRTHSRPRDFVRLMKIAAEHAITARHRKILPKDFESAIKRYSEEFRDELIHEMSSHLPIAKELISMLQQINKNVISNNEFLETYDKTFKKSPSCPAAVDVLKKLYKYNVIGTQTRSRNMVTYSYTHAGSEFIEGRSLYIHPAINKGLLIY